MIALGRTLVLFGAVTAFGCSPSGGRLPTNPNTNANGPDAGTGTWDGGFDDKCGVQDFKLEPGLPPEVMIVLDRSYSMTSSFDNGTRWGKVAESVKQVVSSLQNQIGWGLTVFPSDNDCGVSASVDVQVASMNGPAISSKIDSYTPDGNTPTWKAVQTAAAAMAARTTQNPKYLLLSSDGEPNCGSVMQECTCVLGTPNAQNQCCLGATCFGPCLMVDVDDGEAQAIKEVTDAANAGIHTFVIGVAASGAAGAALDKLAEAGKEARTGTTKYYAVGSQADLVAAVNAIAGQIISCSFALSSPPPSDLDLVDVNVNGTALTRDPTHANGWDFGPGNGSIGLYGPACAALQSSAGSTIQAVYRCPPTL